MVDACNDSDMVAKVAQIWIQTTESVLSLVGNSGLKCRVWGNCIQKLKSQLKCYGYLVFGDEI